MVSRAFHVDALSIKSATQIEVEQDVYVFISRIFGSRFRWWKAAPISTSKGTREVSVSRRGEILREGCHVWGVSAQQQGPPVPGSSGDGEGLPADGRSRD